MFFLVFETSWLLNIPLNDYLIENIKFTMKWVMLAIGKILGQSKSLN
ncbi:unnamed protein product [Paramecium octaurelia]|uniref:Uncharacterized protein n=1 Tax=Paramecium octaurelia TaxID=43137 RepID=A0A8S1YIF6_PAROT|nr:unnamed protein product [Paramecium octaurelia]